MKKGTKAFTLIELLVVTVVIAVLMGVVFRLAGSGGDSSARAKTVSRLQRLANAVSGYYAAFGSYPPVPLQGRSRNIYARVDDSGVQYSGGENGNGTLDWKQVEAACRSQPVALTCPFNSSSDSPVADYIKQIAPQYHLIQSYGGFNRDTSDWCSNQIFTYGLMSYLLPRYKIMMSGVPEMYAEGNKPWSAYNRPPFFADGARYKWADIQNEQNLGSNHSAQNYTPGNTTLARMVDLLPSQAVCARWMPNLEGMVTCHPDPTAEFFGINVASSEDAYLRDPDKWTIISQNGAGGQGVYVQNVFTVRDGWGEDFYYYSPPPYQSYALWSAGPNKKTFPPWMDKTSATADTVNEWIADDIKLGDK